jgi:hypothetical protein
MDINLSISSATSIISNYLVVAIYEETSPTVVVDFQSFAAPHTSSRNISFTGCNPVPHKVIIYENASAAVGGTIRHNFIYNPNFKNAQIREDLFILAGTTAGLSGTSYTDASLAGWTWSLERRGVGTLQKDVDYSWDSGTNTWQLLATSDNPTPSIETGEKFVIHFQPKITTATVPSVNSTVNLFNSVQLAQANTTLDATIMGQAVLIAGTNPYFEITLPDITTVLANKVLYFLFEGGSHINASVKCFGSQKILWLNQNLTELIGGQSEQFALFKWVDPNDNTVFAWRVINPDGNFKTVGEILDIYKETDVLNSVYADGALVSRTSHKRLWNYVNTLDPSMLVSDVDWNNPALNNKGKFSTGDGSTTFRLQRLFTTGFLRAVDSSVRKAGSFEAESVKVADDVEGVKFTGGGTIAGPTDTITTPGRQFNLLDSYDISTGTETKPSNFGVYKLIRR